MPGAMRGADAAAVAAVAVVVAVVLSPALSAAKALPPAPRLSATAASARAEAITVVRRARGPVWMAAWVAGVGKWVMCVSVRNRPGMA